MANLPLELVDTGEKRDALGRRRTPAERQAELVQAFKGSGMSMASFAAREGVNYTTFASRRSEGVRALECYFSL